MVSLSSFLSDPKYAAGLAAAITIVVKMIDNKMSNTKSSVVSYLKSAVFSAGLVGFWVYMINSPSGGSAGSSSRPPMSSFQQRGAPPSRFDAGMAPSPAAAAASAPRGFGGMENNFSGGGARGMYY